MTTGKLLLALTLSTGGLSAFAVPASAENYIVGPLCCAGQLQAHKFPIHGDGNTLCGEWLKTEDPGGAEDVTAFTLRTMFRLSGLAWVDGYYTASAQQWPELRRAAYMTPEAISRWVTAYCKTNPNDTMADAAVVLVATIWKAGR